MKKRFLIVLLSISLFFIFSCNEALSSYPDITGKWKIDFTTTSSTCPTMLIPQTYSMVYTITQEDDYITAISTEDFTYTGNIDNDGNFTLQVSYAFEGYQYDVKLSGKLNGDTFSGSGSTTVKGEIVNCEASFTFTGVKIEDIN